MRRKGCTKDDTLGCEIKKNQQRLPRENDAYWESSVTILFIPSVVFISCLLACATHCLGTGNRAGNGKGTPTPPLASGAQHPCGYMVARHRGGAGGAWCWGQHGHRTGPRSDVGVNEMEWVRWEACQGQGQIPNEESACQAQELELSLKTAKSHCSCQWGSRGRTLGT